ncbi:MAG: hypothetical protein ABI690_27265 [Chloroflexota bacterium]
MLSIRKLLIVLVLAVLMLLLSTFAVTAGNRVLSNNSGDASAPFFVTGEQTLVINGFDLTPLALGLPATIDKISIQVDTPVPGAAVTAVVYQDANGGSPVDATLIGQQSVNIVQPGLFTVTFATPIQVTAPVVWIGFYLPVNFKFQADQSGTSVLTYWAWTSGSTFDLSKLSTAGVLGPANGTSPVSLDMKGIARITGEITGSGVAPTTIPLTPGTPGVSGAPGVITTIVAPASSEDLSVLRVFPPACDTLLWDSADVGITYNGSISVRCTAIWPGYAPAAPLGYERKQLYYDLTFYNDKGNVITGSLPQPVTHCILANAEDIDRAVIGLAWGSPRTFEILTTLRVGNLICAEVYKSGGLSYFVPKA